MDAVSAGGWPGIAEYAREFAQKLTGKTPGGWSVGLLEAVTAEEEHAPRRWLALIADFHGDFGGPRGGRMYHARPWS